MKNYLSHTFNEDDFNLVSVIDELSLWAAPFGLKLLDLIKLKPNINVLDIGCGLGFPLIEIAQRLGDSAKVFGIDPWESAVERAGLKIKTYNLSNVNIIKGVAEQLPFDNKFFDLIVSNNGINNVKDLQLSLGECARVAKPGAQFVFSLNLERSMIEFYQAFEEVLLQNGLNEEISKMKKQIYEKRKPLDEIKSLLYKSGFDIANIYEDSFKLKYLDAGAMFNHSLIKYWFLGGWKKILRMDDMEQIFDQVEIKLNRQAERNGEIVLTIPFVVISSFRK